MKRTIIPFGPQHPVLPEPIHARPRPGGREGRGGDPHDRLHPPRPRAARREAWSSPSSSTWRSASAGSAASCTAWATARAIEKIMGVEVPAARRYLRTDLGRALADPQPPALAGPWRRRLRLREPLHALLADRARRSLDIMRGDDRRPDHLRGQCEVGGVRRDISDSDARARSSRQLQELGGELRPDGAHLRDRSVHPSSPVGVGVLTPRGRARTGRGRTDAARQRHPARYPDAAATPPTTGWTSRP